MSSSIRMFGSTEKYWPASRRDPLSLLWKTMVDSLWVVRSLCNRCVTTWSSQKWWDVMCCQSWIKFHFFTVQEYTTRFGLMLRLTTDPGVRRQQTPKSHKKANKNFFKQICVQSAAAWMWGYEERIAFLFSLIVCSLCTRRRRRVRMTVAALLTYRYER
jgi:hypothetical protein